MHTTDLKLLPRVDLRLTALGLGCSQMGGLYHATSAREVGLTVDPESVLVFPAERQRDDAARLIAKS